MNKDQIDQTLHMAEQLREAHARLAIAVEALEKIENMIIDGLNDTERLSDAIEIAEEAATKLRRKEVL